MNAIKYAGVTGVTLFWLMVIINGFVYPEYSHLSQFISELGAQNAPWAAAINFLGIVPFGIGITLHSIFLFNRKLTAKIRFFTLFFFFLCGSFFALAGFYHCDVECSFEDISTEGIIHNLAAMFAFLMAVIGMLFFGLEHLITKSNLINRSLFNLTSILGLIGFLLIAFEGIDSPIRGLLQRLFLFNFSIWIWLSTFKSNDQLLSK